MLNFNLNLEYNKESQTLKINDNNNVLNFKNVKNDIDVQSSISLFLANNNYLENEDYE